MTSSLQRLTSFVLAVALAIPLSVSAETRRPARTDMRQLAADLDRALGHTDPAAIADDPIVDAMNRERAARGLGPLRLNRELSLAAEDRVHDMFAKHYFNHVAPDGTQPFVWAERRGYDYRVIGENLAVGYRGTAVVDGWMRSPAHRANILGRDFDEVGLAVADGSPERGYRGPLVVALYGAR